MAPSKVAVRTSLRRELKDGATRLSQMTPDQLLLKHFKTQTAIAKAAGVTRQAVCNWFGRGSISYPAAVILADKMGIAAGKLQVRWVPSTKRQLNARDARKMMKRIVAQKKALYE